MVPQFTPRAAAGEAKTKAAATVAQQTHVKISRRFMAVDEEGTNRYRSVHRSLGLAFKGCLSVEDGGPSASVGRLPEMEGGRGGGGREGRKGTCPLYLSGRLDNNTLPNGWLTKRIMMSLFGNMEMQLIKSNICRSTNLV